MAELARLSRGFSQQDVSLIVVAADFAPRMLFLNKLLPIFVLPLGWVFLLAIFGIVRRKRWPLVTALVVLYVSSMPLVSNGLIGGIESRNPPVPLAAAGPADAIVPLGGIFGPPVADGYLANVASSGDRLEAGIVLWQLHQADWLVFTGGRIPWEGRTEVEGAISRRAAIARGVPADRVLVTGEIGNTRDEALAIAAIMKERGWKKIILVTSAWHMPRAAHLFRKAGVDIVPFPVDFRHDGQRKVTLLDFLPNAGALADTELAVREWYGLAFYALTGR